MGGLSVNSPWLDVHIVNLDTSRLYLPVEGNLHAVSVGVVDVNCTGVLTWAYNIETLSDWIFFKEINDLSLNRSKFPFFGEAIMNIDYKFFFDIAKDDLVVFFWDPNQLVFSGLNGIIDL